MRNLKRVLSLALAAIMLMGMMVMGTGAANVSDFTDSEKITNLEAASVTTAIDIFSGYGDGSFGGENYVNRAEMATIICKILLGSNVNADIYKGLGNFQDLAGYEWAEGYINMCASRGIVNGTSATTYEPGRPVKTWEAALMLQRALGWWDQKDPLNSTISEVTVSSKSGALGLYGNLILYADEYLTRNDVAEMVFNAITKCVPVEYNESFSLYRNAGSPSIFSGVVFNYTDTLAYQTFGLVYAAGEQDVYGRPAITWGYGKLASTDIDDDGNIESTYKVGSPNFKTALTTVADTPVLEYTTAVTGRTLYNDLGLREVSNTIDLPLAFDGFDNSGSLEVTVARNDTDSKGLDVATNYITGNGVLTQVFKTEGAAKPYKVVVINTYIMEVDNVIEATRNDDAKVTLAARENATANYPYTAGSFDANYETEAFAKGDVVLVNFAYSTEDTEYQIQSMELAESLQGEMTRYTETKNTMVVGGVTYSFNLRSSQDANEYKANGGNVGNEVVIYLDNYGYAIDVQDAGNEKTTDYALVLAVDKDSASVFNNNNAWVKLLLMDNTVVEAKFSWDSKNAKEWSYPALTAGKEHESKDTLYKNLQTLVTYSVNDKGTYTLYKVDTDNWAGLKTDTNRSVASNVGGAGSKFMNNSTILIMPVDKNRDKYVIYTGVREIPNINESGMTKVALDSSNSSLAGAIYTETEVAATNTDLIYIASKGEYVNDKDLGPYVNYTAVINGEIVELKVKGEVNDITGEVTTAASTNIVVNALYSSITTNSKGVVTSAAYAVEDTDREGSDKTGDFYKGTGIVRARKDIIGVGADDEHATYYTWSDDVLVARIEKDANNNKIYVSNPSITSLPTIHDAIVYYGVARGNAGQITWIYVADNSIGEAASAVTENTSAPEGEQNYGGVASGATLTAGEHAKPTIDGDVKGEVAATDDAIVTIKGSVEGTVSAAGIAQVTVEGTVKAGAEITAESGSTLKLKNVEAGATITVQPGATLVIDGEQKEVITVDPEMGAKVSQDDLMALPAGVYSVDKDKVDTTLADSIGWDVNTVGIRFTTPGDDVTITAEQGEKSYHMTFDWGAANTECILYMSLKRPYSEWDFTNGDYQDVTEPDEQQKIINDTDFTASNDPITITVKAGSEIIKTFTITPEMACPD